MKRILATCVLLAGCAQFAEAQSASMARPLLNLMPVPSSVVVHDGLLVVDSTFRVSVNRPGDQRLMRAIQRMIPRLESRTGIALSREIGQDTAATGSALIILCDAAGQEVQGIDEVESYSIESTSSSVTLHAATTVGVIRGLETLLQLVDANATHYFIPSVSISDTPRFRWRGLLVDVSRHFEPVSTIERTLDGMSAVKLNVLHWHLSDDQGIRVESRRYPRLHGMGSDSLYYTQAQIRDVVAYARDRGIRVVPEFDMPGHSTAWFVGYPQYASVPGPYNIQRGWSGYHGVFDPTQASVYRFVDGFVGEMSSLFPDAYWHIGGDEVNPTQWKQSQRIQNFMAAHHLADNAALQAYFNQRLSAILTRHHRRMIGWDEILHPDLPRTTVVQSWRGTKYLGQAVSQGFNGILSAPYYLDAMKSAEYLYLADPLAGDSTLSADQSARVLGGEACMWAELVNNGTIDSRIWPRLAVIAERFWSPQGVTDVGDMYRRLAVQNVRLEQLGLGQESHTSRSLRRMVNGPDIAALNELLRFSEPVTLGQRVRGGPTLQTTPLVQLVDAAIPDPPARWHIGQMAAAIARAGHAGGAAAVRDSLGALFTEWQELPARVREIGARSPLAQAGIPAADALAGVGKIGLAALEARKSGMPLPRSWLDSAGVALNAADRPQGLLHLVVVPAVRRLLEN